jgi:hypothetical protein
LSIDTGTPSPTSSRLPRVVRFATSLEELM